MTRVHEHAAPGPGGKGSSHAVRLVAAAVGAQALSAIVVVTAAATDAPLGAPDYWPWLLTGLQVLALWSAGRGRWWGWLLGAAVQVPWIAYAVVTAQLGFIPGCAVSAAVQAHNFLGTQWRARRSQDHDPRRVQVYG